MRRQLTRGPIVALELVGDDCVNQWHGLMGPSDPSDARAAAPDSLRARFGTSPDANAVYGSASNDDALAELAAIFDPATGQYAGVFRDCTLCIIKPHVVTAKSAGQVSKMQCPSPGQPVNQVELGWGLGGGFVMGLAPDAPSVARVVGCAPPVLWRCRCCPMCCPALG